MTEGQDTGQGGALCQQQQQQQDEEVVQSVPTDDSPGNAVGSSYEITQQQQQLQQHLESSGLLASHKDSSSQFEGMAASDGSEFVQVGQECNPQEQQQQQREPASEVPLTVMSASARLLSYAASSQQLCSDSVARRAEGAGCCPGVQPLEVAPPYAHLIAGKEVVPCSAVVPGSCSSLAAGAAGRQPSTAQNCR
jgi:hypothetical protein